VNRLSRRLALVAVITLAAIGAGGCGFVQPPALTISKDSASEPFYTYSADELFAEINKQDGEAATGTNTTRADTIATSRVAELLTGKVRPRILESILADKGVVPSEADKALVQKAAQQQQSPPTQDEIEFQTNFVALAGALANEFFGKAGNNIDDYARKYYDQRKDSFAQAAQSCLHVVTVDAAADPANPQARPTDAAIQAVLPQAQALRQRLNTESFEAVSKDSGQSAADIPGGDLGCRNDSELPPDVITGLKDVPVGTISQPVKWPVGWVIARVDDRKPARTPTFEEVRNDAVTATRQTFGQQFVTELLDRINKQYVVKVDPRFGRWSPEQAQVLTPEGAATPSMPTTTTTMPKLLDDHAPETQPGSPTTTTPSTTVPSAR
jgi:parvulin-like peptidyl-prolyl isomerase